MFYALSYGKLVEKREQYYMTLLQLYMPWRDGGNLKGTFHTFEE